MADRRRSEQTEREAQTAVPTVAIYQNPEHVSGILQQVYGQPLLTDRTAEERSENSDTSEGQKSGKGSLGASAKVPLMGNIEAKIGADYQKRLSAQSMQGSAFTSNWKYTQAYYLYAVRAALRKNGLVRAVTGNGDTKTLRPGEFIEFSATFEPSQIIAFLDIATPDLIAAITRSQVRKAEIARFHNAGGPEAARKFALEMESKVTSAEEVARAVSEAVRVDFRSTKTREFYARIGTGADAVTAITICDNEHFVVADEDRILDGQFTVLGKVTTTPVDNLPILNRNKVLDRFKPEAVDFLMRQLNGAVSGNTQDLVAAIPEQGDRRDEEDDDGGGDEQAMTDASGLFDFALASRVEGPSFNVVPVAIYI